MDEYDQSRLGSLPGDTPDLDPEWAEYVAWVDREMAAARDCEPDFWAPGEAEPEDQDSWAPCRPRFGQGDEADVLPPGPHLAGLTEEAVLDLGRLSDNELIGVLQATRRQLAREQYKQVLVTAEFGRRRQAAFEDAVSRGIPVGCRPGGFPGEELAFELVTTPAEAGHRIDDAIDLTTRLPMTLAGLAAGQIDEARAGWIAMYTRSLSPADAAKADEILADAAPDLRVEQVARKAAALEKKFAPEAAKARKERTKQTGQRVEARRELSGNASLSGREMDTVDVMASKTYIDAIAVKLRDGGVAGPIGTLRVLALADLTQGRNPLDRLKETTEVAAQEPSGPAAPEPDLDSWPGWGPDPADDSFAGEHDDPACDDAAPQGKPTPMPAQINLIVPVGTLLDWSSAPAQAGAWGLLDSDETRTNRRCGCPASPHSLVLYPHRPGRHRPSPRLRPRPAPPATQRPRIAAPASAASGTPPPPEPHLHPDRHRHLRPHPSRRALHPKPQAQAPRPRPHRHLRRPRLPGPGPDHRPRPHHSLACGPYGSVQPGPALPKAPSRQASS